MINNQCYAKLVNPKINSRKFWFGFTFGEEAWTLYGRLKENLEDFQTLNVHRKVLVDSKAFQYIQHKKSEKVSEGYLVFPHEDVPWLSETNLRQLINDKLSTSYDLGIRVNNKVAAISSSDFRDAADKARLVLDLMSKRGIEHDLKIGFSGTCVSVTEKDTTLTFGVVPTHIWDDVDQTRQKLILDHDQGHMSFLNPNGKGAFTVQTKCQMIDLPVRLVLYALEDRFTSIFDSFKTDYSKCTFDFPGYERFEWAALFDEIRPILVKTGYIKIPVSSNEYLRTRKRTKFSGAFSVN